MSRILAVAAGGALGAIARYGMTVAVATAWKRHFPLATFLVNLTGCFLLGVIGAWAAQRTALGRTTGLLLVTGFLGAFTTFSTFEQEAHRLVSDGFPWLAAFYAAVSVAGGFVAYHAGTMFRLHG